MYNEKRTIDLVVSQLCAQIDEYKCEIAYWQEKYESLNNQYIEESNQRLEDAKKSVGQALMFALSVEDSPNGDLVIKKDKRKDLAEQYSTQCSE